jgi:large conductance mechanosensitive channel
VLKYGVQAAAPYAYLAAAKAAGAVTINYGLFINSVISFTIVAFALFILIKGMNQMRRNEAPPEPKTKDCKFCFSAIPIQATRCP